MVVLFVPLPVVETKSGPQAALQATAIHIAVIASEAHISRTWITSNRRAQVSTQQACVRWLDMAHLLSVSRLAGPRTGGIRDETGRAALESTYRGETDDLEPCARQHRRSTAAQIAQWAWSSPARPLVWEDGDSLEVDARRSYGELPSALRWCPRCGFGSPGRSMASYPRKEDRHVGDRGAAERHTARDQLVPCRGRA